MGGGTGVVLDLGFVKSVLLVQAGVALFQSCTGCAIVVEQDDVS